MKTVDLKIGDLRLDNENPRFEEQSSQLDTLQALIDDQGTKLYELAIDIHANGLNPMDRLMVMKSGTKDKSYITLEGNRRTAALKILNTPEILSDIVMSDSLRSKFLELSADFDASKIEPISAVIMVNRDDARRWIELRHTGQNRGKGIVDWNGIQTARFRGEKTLKLVEAVQKSNLLDSPTTEALAKGFPITTLERLIDNADFRQKIGLSIEDGEIHLNYPLKEVLKPLVKIVSDIATKKKNVSDLKNKALQKAYLNEFTPSELPTGNKLKDPKPIDEVIGNAPVPTPSPPPPPPTKSPLDRRTLMPKHFYVTTKNQKASQIFFELKTLNIGRYPVSGAVMLRLFLEAGLDIYANNNKLNFTIKNKKNETVSMSLAQKLDTTIKHLQSKGVAKNKLNPAKVALTEKDGVISVKVLHDYVHNTHMFPSRTDLISAWGKVESFFEELWK